MTDNVLRIDPKDPDASFKMMTTPDAWPLGPVLPVERKRPVGLVIPASDALAFGGPSDLELGVMTIHPAVPRWAVIRINLHDIRMRTLLWRGEIDPSLTVYRYDDVQGVEAGGWIVA